MEHPLTPTPVLPPVSPALQRLALTSQRQLIAGAVVCVAGLGVALSALFSAGFARGELLVAAAVICALGLPWCMVGSRGSKRALRQSGYPRYPGVVAVVTPGYLLEPEPPGLLSLTVLVLLPLLFCLAVGLLPSVVAARTLGHPSAGTAVGGSTFRLADGAQETTELVGAFGPVSSANGDPVVYDVDNPSRAMSASDYRAGDSGRRLAQLVFVVLLAVAILTWSMGVTRVRRRSLCTGRPSVPITGVRVARRGQGRDSLVVTYADGVSVRFSDTPPQRSALLRRLEQDPGGCAPPGTLVLLSTGGR